MQITDRLPCAACIGDAEVGVGLQDELLVGFPDVADFGDFCVEGRDPVYNLPLASPVEAVGVGGGLGSKHNVCRAVVALLSDVSIFWTSA